MKEKNTANSSSDVLPSVILVTVRIHTPPKYSHLGALSSFLSCHWLRLLFTASFPPLF